MDNCYGEKLTALAAALSIQIAQGKTADDLALLGIFFTVIGDQLSLLSLTKPNCAENKKE